MSVKESHLEFSKDPKRCRAGLCPAKFYECKFLENNDLPLKPRPFGHAEGQLQLNISWAFIKRPQQFGLKGGVDCGFFGNDVFEKPDVIG